MPKYDEILDRVREAKDRGELPLSIPSDSVKTDQKQILRILKSKGVTSIGVSTEPDKGLLWFRKR